MKKSLSKFGWTVGLIGIAGAALAGDLKPAPPEEPAGFVTGAVIGAFAAGPIGAVVGAGLGTWLGNRVHRAGEAAKYQAAVAKSEAAASRFAAAAAEAEAAAVNSAEAKSAAAKALDGLQGDVMFRTGSHEISPEVARQIEVLAQAAVKSPALKIRVDGYADSRGPADANLVLSEARADAVRDLLRVAGVNDEALEINAYGDTQSVADDIDGYALERRVRLTLESRDAAPVAQMGQTGGH